MAFPNGLTDIHNHVLFNVDDGPIALEESLDLLSTMKIQGVHRVFCTSHYRHPYFPTELKTFAERFETLCEATESLPGSYPDLSLAAEVRICPEFYDDIRDEQIPTLGKTPYILIEFPGHDVPKIALDIIYELKIRGYLPILAHPERNVAIQKDLTWLEKLLELDVYFQLTAECFLEGPGDPHTADTLAWRILRQSRATVVASDAHNTTTRPPALSDAYSKISQKLGEDVTEKLKNNANAIWTGEEITPVRVAHSNLHRRPFSFFRRGS